MTISKRITDAQMDMLLGALRRAANLPPFPPLKVWAILPDPECIKRLVDIAKAFGGDLMIDEEFRMIFLGVNESKRRDLEIAVEQALEAYKARLAYQENDRWRGAYDRAVDARSDKNVIPFDVAMRSTHKAALQKLQAKLGNFMEDLAEIIQEMEG